MKIIDTIQQRFLLRKKKKVVCYGASLQGKAFFEAHSSRFNIVAFCDGDATKVGSFFCGVPVLSLSSIANIDYDKVVITSQYVTEIGGLLDRHEIPYEEYLAFNPPPFRVAVKYYWLLCLYWAAKCLSFVMPRNRRDLHVITNGVFVTPFSQLLFERFSPQEHDIFCCSNVDSQAMYAHSAFSHEASFQTGAWHLNSVKDNFALFFKLNLSRKIYVHGFFPHMCFPWLVDKGVVERTTWVAWGRDVYTHYAKNSLIDRKLRNTKKAIQSCVYFDLADYQYIKNYYNHSVKGHLGFYPNPLECQYLDSTFLGTSGLRVLVGNSAATVLNHLEVLKALAALDTKFTCVVPLSYGDKEYAAKVIQNGERLLHDFESITSFMAPKKYAQFLSNIDIAIFHSNQQIALSTIYALLFNKTTVYISSKNTGVWTHLVEELGLVVRDSNSILNGQNLHLLTEDEAELNRNIATRFFDLQWIEHKWRDIFHSNR